MNVCLAFGLDSFYQPWCLMKQQGLKLVAALQSDTNGFDCVDRLLMSWC